ncbi:NAD-dependent epimerase/dehydratase family protein [Nanoarchaeota archaeon]
MKILITGGAGFIGSNAAEYYAADSENEVIVFDNLSRAKLMHQEDKNARHNWDFLKQFKNIKLVEGDTRKFEEVKDASKDADTIIHLAGQTAVTTSVTDPRTDFEINARGAFNVLEAARINDVKNVVYSSTNKVFGHNVNHVGIVEEEKRYRFEDKFANGIPTDFSIDLCEHTPYGCSKLAADLYMQDYHHQYGLKTGVFRMSCIYGTRQFGFEDQGWVAWFTIATLKGTPLTIFGDGKQVRDALYVTDLVKAYDNFLKSDIKHGVYSMGGGKDNTMSLLELLDMLEELTGKRSKISFSDWRPSDQKVFIADTTKAQNELNWKPGINPRMGMKKLVDWVQENLNLF